MNKKPIHTDDAPSAIGTYSQAIEANGLVFLSGQIPLDPATMEIVDGDFDESISVQPKAASFSRTLQRRVAVWSDGKNPDKAKDDVTTW